MAVFFKHNIQKAGNLKNFVLDTVLEILQK